VQAWVEAQCVGDMLQVCTAAQGAAEPESPPAFSNQEVVAVVTVTALEVVQAVVMVTALEVVQVVLATAWERARVSGEAKAWTSTLEPMRRPPCRI